MNQIDQLMIEDDEGFQPGYLHENFEVAVTGNQRGVMVEALLCDQRVSASAFSQLGEIDGEGDFAFEAPQCRIGSRRRH